MRRAPRASVGRPTLPENALTSTGSHGTGAGETSTRSWQDRQARRSGSTPLGRRTHEAKWTTIGRREDDRHPSRALWAARGDTCASARAAPTPSRGCRHREVHPPAAARRRPGDALSTTGPGAPAHRSPGVRGPAERPSALRELGLGAVAGLAGALGGTGARQGDGGGRDPVHRHRRVLLLGARGRRRGGARVAAPGRRGRGRRRSRPTAEPSSSGWATARCRCSGRRAMLFTAALQAQRGRRRIEVRGHTPQLRAGVHVGRPRRVGRDYLGVDVNIAARIGEAAKAGEVLVSETACEHLDADSFELGRSRRFAPPGPRRASGFAGSGGVRWGSRVARRFRRRDHNAETRRTGEIAAPPFPVHLAWSLGRSAILDQWTQAAPAALGRRESRPTSRSVPCGSTSPISIEGESSTSG